MCLDKRELCRCISMGYSTVQKAVLIDSHREGSCQVTSRSILYLKGKYRTDTKGGGEGVSSSRQFDVKR